MDPCLCCPDYVDEDPECCDGGPRDSVGDDTVCCDFEEVPDHEFWCLVVTF